MKHAFVRINYFAIILVVTGVCTLGFITYSQRASISPVSAISVKDTPQKQNFSKEVIRGVPVTLEIPSLEKVFALKKGSFSAATRSWTLSSDAAYYADVSNPANNHSGTTLIYGHNRKNVFAKLVTLKPDDVVVVKTDNGHVFHYALQSVVVVAPEDTSQAITNNGEPRLILQTCTGLFWEKRQLFIFSLERVE